MINSIPRILLSILLVSISGLILLTSQALAFDESELNKKQEEILKQADENLPKPACSTETVVINQGEICGQKVNTQVANLTQKTVNAFLGIPYGESTAGKNRWKPPIPDDGWKGVYKATKFGPACPQRNKFNPDLPYSEDCLSLNVWTPSEKSDKPRSVLLFIYGGSYRWGYAGNPVYKGANLSAQGDLVVVTINYRLGSLGFLAGVKDKKLGLEINGNYGLMDQILAMKWIKDNISKFGGDPNKVTIQGESAGAASVAIHLTGEQSTQDLFNSAIMQSSPLGIPYKTKKDSEHIAKAFAKNLGCEVNDIECMRSKTTKETVDAQNQINFALESALHGIKDFVIFGPVIDGEIVTAHPLKKISKKNIEKPLILGTNMNEGLTFVGLTMNMVNLDEINDVLYIASLDLIFRNKKLNKEILKRYPTQNGDNGRILGKLLTDYLFTCPSLHIADNSTSKTWVYVFDHIPSFNPLDIIGISVCDHAVCHTAELPFVFHTAQEMGYSFTDEETQLSTLMMDYWTNFINNTNPNTTDKPNWPEYKSKDKNVVLVTPIDEIESKQDLKADCEFWDKIGYDLHTSFWDIF